jgi:hypothetical protein
LHDLFFLEGIFLVMLVSSVASQTLVDLLDVICYGKHIYVALVWQIKVGFQVEVAPLGVRELHFEHGIIPKDINLRLTVIDDLVWFGRTPIARRSKIIVVADAAGLR